MAAILGRLAASCSCGKCIEKLQLDKMPDFCAAYGCSNCRSIETRSRGITFHKFPKTRERRRQWEVALRRQGFVASERTVICSDHFRSKDFDRTGQTVRLKDGVVPTLFNFPSHLQRLVTTRQVEENLPIDPCQDETMSDQRGTTAERRKCIKQQATDHSYTLPACPKAINAKLNEASARVRKLQREKTNALKRERRVIRSMLSLLEELKEKNLITEDLKDKLECYSGKLKILG